MLSVLDQSQTPSRASISYQQTRRPLRHAHGTSVTDEVEAAALPITLPFAGAAVVGDISISPIAATAIAARIILCIVISSIVGQNCPDTTEAILRS
jgi:hypothetical protein